MAKLKKVKTPPNPLPCGCSVWGTRDLGNAVETGHSLRVGWRDIHIRHCPLHAAAADLLAMLKRAVNGGCSWKKGSDLVCAENLITKAETKE